MSMDLSSLSWISWFRSSTMVKAETSGGVELDGAEAVGGGTVGLGAAR
jgi:hypothetical protein